VIILVVSVFSLNLQGVQVKEANSSCLEMQASRAQYLDCRSRSTSSKLGEKRSTTAKHALAQH
jgi:hypothetical protein